jgi:fumarate hydratase subunit alpha
MKSSMWSLMEARNIVEALRVLETSLPHDIEEKLRECLLRERGNSRIIIKTIIENVTYARKEIIPICQDTGILVFFVRCPEESKKVLDVIRKGVELATKEVPLRANTVNPFTRKNQGRNLGRDSPIVHFEGEKCKKGEGGMDILARGAGSENVSSVFMLQPDVGIKGIKSVVVETVRKAGAKPCPPIIVGVGVGGTQEWSAYLSKKALLRPLNKITEDPIAAQLERELLLEVNKLGIGPMGFGGKTTALGVRVEWAHCHTASLPVSVSIQCWALRRVSAKWEKGEFRILR